MHYIFFHPISWTLEDNWLSKVLKIEQGFVSKHACGVPNNWTFGMLMACSIMSFKHKLFKDAHYLLL